MANPYHHALSSVKKWGGIIDDYMPIHEWFDATKAHHADFRHRALRHHSEGIFLMESIFGPTIQLSNACPNCDYKGPCTTCPACVIQTREGKRIPTRWIGEQHVTEDLGRIPAATEWLSALKPEPWMNRSRKLSRELEGASV